MLQITALMDNKASGHHGLIAEHGLSLFVEYNGQKILFDCGPGANSLYNARKLGIDLKNLDGVVLSHSHYDHCAGYRDLVEANWGSSQLFTGPCFFEKKYARNGICYTDISAGFGLDFLKEHGIVHREVTDLTAVSPGMYLVTGFPRIHSFETIPQRFVRRKDGGFVSDDFCDEICMVLEAGEELVVIVGCSHPGILNIISHIQKLFGKPIKAVFGGTHLVEADGERIETTITALHKAGLEILGLSHCSGDETDCAIAYRTDIQGCHLAVGDVFFLDT